MKRIGPALCLSTCLVACLLVPAAGRAGGQGVADSPATRAGAMSLAARHIADVTPSLPMEGKESVAKILFALDAQKNVPAIQGQAIAELVNHCTIALAKTKGIESVLVTSAHLVRYAPDNPRTINLFGVVLHAIGRNADAIAVLEYAYARETGAPTRVEMSARARRRLARRGRHSSSPSQRA